MGQDALEDVPYPISANGQQLISRVITGNTSTPPPPQRDQVPTVPAAVSPQAVLLPAGPLAGVFAGHAGGLLDAKRKCWPSPAARLSSLSR